MNKFDNGSIKVYNGDAIKLMTEMASLGMTVDCIVSDPPYLTTSRGNAGNSGGCSKKIKTKKVKSLLTILVMLKTGHRLFTKY